MDSAIVKDLSRLASEARRKADYLRLLPEGDYMQQASSEVLVEMAQDIEKLVAKYFIFYDLLKDEKLNQTISRQCRYAIRMAVKQPATLE